jgi:O-antigen ligase
MSAISNFLRRVSTVGLWGGVCGLFSFFLASRNLFFPAAILFGLLLLVAMLLGPRALTLLWVVGQPTIFGLPNQVLKAIPLVNVERVLFVSIVGMMALNMVFGRKKYAGLSSLEVLMVVFLTYALISLAMSTQLLSLRKDLWFYMQYMMPMMMFMISRRMDWSERDVRVIFAWLSLAGVVIAVIGVLQLALGFTIYVPAENITHAEDRAVGTFVNPGEFGAVLSMFLLLTLLQYSWYRDALARSALLLAMLAMTIAILLAKSRAPWLGLVCAIGIIYVRDRSVRPLIVVGAVIGLVSLAALWSLMAEQIGFESRVTNVDTIQSRLINWATALNMIVHNPVFGIGFGYESYLLERHEYMITVGSLPIQDGVSLSTPHNEFLQVGLMLGILGLVMFLGIMYLLLRLVLAEHVDLGSSPLYRQCALYVFAIVISVLIKSMFSTTAQHAYLWTATYFLAGLVAGMPATSHVGRLR